jgi:hypothetical protein
VLVPLQVDCLRVLSLQLLDPGLQVLHLRAAVEQGLFELLF